MTDFQDGGRGSSGWSRGDAPGRGGPTGGDGPGRIFDDLARLVTDAAGLAQGARREVETVLRTQGERIIGQMDLVQRDEFEAVKEMASKARMENEALRSEIEALTARLDAMDKPATKRKSAAKKSSEG